MPSPSADNDKSLEERANETKEKGRLLAVAFNKIRYISVSGYCYNPGSSFSIVYDKKEGFDCDWETLKATIRTTFNGLSAEILVHEDEQLYPPVLEQKKDKDATKLELLIKPASKVEDAYKRQEIISKGISKLTDAINNYLKNHPNAIKTEN